MRSIISILSILTLITFTGCDKELDQQPVSNVTEGNFYKNSNDFIQAVNGTYAQLKNYPLQALWLGEVRSDNLNVLNAGNRDWQGVRDFLPTISTVGFVVNSWNNNFNGIFNANSVIAALDEKGSIITDAALRSRLAGEVHFLRAFYYFQLVRLYGKTPLVDKPITATEAASIPRSPVADIYNLIIKDLEFAALNLPPSYTGANIGRATSWAAKGLLGLVYLTRSGPTYGVEGPGLNSNEYDKALKLFNEVIDSRQFEFLPDYASIFSYTNENNKEVIFDVQFMSSGNGTNVPNQLVPVPYFTSIGLSNSYGNGFGSSNFSISRDLIASYSAGGNDIRRTFNINSTYNANSTFIKKYLDISKRGVNGTDWPINFIVLRYTDILLMKAEAILHGGGGTQAEVDEIVNRVRTRAGIGSVPLTNVTLGTLMEERRKEFLGEGLRWNDLIREGLAVTTLNSWIAKDQITTIKPVVPEYIIYPVPSGELFIKSGLYEQNKGYN